MLVLLLTMSLLGACTPGQARWVEPQGSGSPGPDPTDFRRGPADITASADAEVSVTTIARHLDIPWGVTFLPGGSALVTERRTGRILRVGPQRRANGELAVTPVAKIAEASNDNEGGLLGIAASPRYALDQTIFVYYTTAVDNRVARLRLGQHPTPIVTGIPKSGVHDGGRLAFGPDGYLYATTGEASHSDAPQRLENLGGKILRMTTDGKPPPGNPFPGSLVWSYGHRNPEGLAWDRHGNLYSTEIGEATWDELNAIRPGGNYGWPMIEGIGGTPGYVDPVVTWHPEVGVSAGIAIQGSTAVVACLRGQRIYLVRLDGAVTRDSSLVEGATGASGIRWRPGAGVAGRPVEALAGRYGRLRTAIAAPDGSIWLTTSNRDGRNPQGVSRDDDRILRLTSYPAAR